MSFLKKLFGGGGGGGNEETEGRTAKSISYEGFTIHARPYKSEGQYQTAGLIEKEVEGVRKEHRFIRADRFMSLDDAVECALNKGRQLVEQQGEKMFG